MPSGHADSTGFSSTSASGVLKTGASFVDGDGGAGAGEDDWRVIVLENGRRSVMRDLSGNCAMCEPSADARWRHREQIMVEA